MHGERTDLPLVIQDEALAAATADTFFGPAHEAAYAAIGGVGFEIGAAALRATRSPVITDPATTDAAAAAVPADAAASRDLVLANIAATVTVDGVTVVAGLVVAEDSVAANVASAPGPGAGARGG